jgi:acetylornithine deacetylase/succinyl-diaminopimelate desuccinylase-like protein
VTPDELLRRLLRFPTVNPPGAEAECIRFLAGLLHERGVDSRLLALDPQRPNLLARLQGRGEAPPLLLYGHVDVVPVEGQLWTAEPFAGTERDGFIWGRGAIDMKAGVAMLVSAFLAAAAGREPPPGDLVLCLVSDEEAGGVLGTRFLVEQHAGEFAGVRHAVGELGGISMPLGGRRLYPVMVAEKQSCRVTATVRGPGGHGSLPMRGGAMAGLGEMVTRLDRNRLPMRVTPPVKLMLQAIAEAVPDLSGVLSSLLDPAQADATVDALGAPGRLFDALLHDTLNATIVRGGTAVNVIPAEIQVEMDARLVPGATPDELLEELREVAGADVELAVDRFDPGPSSVDMSAFDVFAGVLREADPEGAPVPMVLSGVTDGRFFARLGIQTYGFLPMRFPPDLDFSALIHAADERVPVGEVAWGAERIGEAIARYRG